MGYDLIGDIHGQADKLEALLQLLGYRVRDGVWRCLGRQAIFVGDFIDRGPRQVDTVHLVRAMIEAGSALAVMGNHELNAIAWHTPDLLLPGEYLRSHRHPLHGDRNRRQHQRFLDETEPLPRLHADLINWFLTLPLWLELPGIRVVHACWHPPFMGWISSLLGEGNRLMPELLREATREPADEASKDSADPSVFKAVEALLKGVEVPLPPFFVFTDKDGVARSRVRVRWWDAAAVRYPQAAMLSPELCAGLPDLPIPPHARLVVPDDKPIFFGHYWLTGSPSLQAPHAACLDYSAGRSGPLVAYRWDGESPLNPTHFVSVP